MRHKLYHSFLYQRKSDNLLIHISLQVRRIIRSKETGRNAERRWPMVRATVAISPPGTGAHNLVSIDPPKKATGAGGLDRNSPF